MFILSLQFYTKSYFNGFIVSKFNRFVLFVQAVLEKTIYYTYIRTFCLEDDNYA